jgi:hypothetical protein
VTGGGLKTSGKLSAMVRGANRFDDTYDLLFFRLELRFDEEEDDKFRLVDFSVVARDMTDGSTYYRAKHVNIIK